MDTSSVKVLPVNWAGWLLCGQGANSSGFSWAMKNGYDLLCVMNFTFTVDNLENETGCGCDECVCGLEEDGV